MSGKKKDSDWLGVFIVLFIIILLILYVVSFGKLNIGNNLKAPNEFKDDKEQAQRRHNKLKALIEKKEALKIKLEKRFKRIYFLIRLGFVAVWAAYLYIFILLGHVNNLEDVLNYSEAAILGWVALNFLTFGNLSTLNGFIDLIKMRLENWIWGKHLNLDSKIELNKQEVVVLETTINKA